MFEKVNPSHPDKIADRIAGAIVDYAYSIEENPKVAVEVLIGHGVCTVVSEASVDFPIGVVRDIVDRIAGKNINIQHFRNKQDAHLAQNQSMGVKCGDNGIFKGVPTTTEQKMLSNIARDIYVEYPFDGKYILDENSRKLIICQSNARTNDLVNSYSQSFNVIANPLGDWTGGINVDAGATNRKLGSDMGDAVTGGGLHGKDLSKADVSVNIYAHLKAQATGDVVNLCCAIGDGHVDGKPYSEIVEIAKKYINSVGGFEKFAEWGLL